MERAAGPVFFKDTTDERYPVLLQDAAFLERDAIHTFLIRHPAESIASYLTGRSPVVVDAADLVADPEGTVRAYCSRVGIPFLPDSLTWEPGERAEWRPTARWHVDVSASTGITGTSAHHHVDVAAHPALSRYLDYHLPYYDELRERRLTVHSDITGPSAERRRR